MIQKCSLCIIVILLHACTYHASSPSQISPPVQEKLVVFAAASLSEAFGEMSIAFCKIHPDLDLVLNLAGSNTLRAQIEQGARVDVFASANTKEMIALVEQGLVNQNEPKIFLTNQLVVIAPANNPAKITKLEDLSRSGTKLVLAANDVPAGKYSRTMLENAGPLFKADVLANTVSNETTVKQVVAKVQLGEADAGIVYSSDAIAAPDLIAIVIPEEFNVRAQYLIAPLMDSTNPDLAMQFIFFVLSPEGQGILDRWGFTSISAPFLSTSP
jgi:molybdate transport system substrate-binding protein